jgi:hypothetical protein
VGEQYAARLDVLAVVLGRLSPAQPRSAGRLGFRTVRQRVERWEHAGWASRRRMLGHTWVLPTRAGLRMAGLELTCWEPTLDRLAHHHAAAVVRLAREPVPGLGGWVCERELWRRRGKAGWHLADGALPAPVPSGWQGISEAWELVEVELHQKARPRLVAALKTRPPHTARVTYYVPATLLGPLSAQFASVVRELGGRPAAGRRMIPAGAVTNPCGAGGILAGRCTTISSATVCPPAAHPRAVSCRCWSPWACSCSAPWCCWHGRSGRRCCG